MNFTEQYINGVWVIEPLRFGDKRGYFSEVFKQADFEAHVGHVDFVQDNESFSTRGVLRGLHFQRGEWSQAKLVPMENVSKDGLWKPVSSKKSGYAYPAQMFFKYTIEVR